MNNDKIAQELLFVSNKNIALKDELEKLKVELEEMRNQLNPLKKTFLEVLDESMEYRERLHYHDINEWYYDKFEKSQLL